MNIFGAVRQHCDTTDFIYLFFAPGGKKCRVSALMVAGQNTQTQKPKIEIAILIKQLPASLR